MKFKNVFLILLTFIVLGSLVACNSQAKKNEEDQQRLLVISDKIDELYNEDKTDINEEFTNEQIDEIDELLAAEKDNQFSEDNLLLIDKLLDNLDTALDMMDFEYKVDALFDGVGGVLKDAFVDVLEIEIETYKEKDVFYKRQKDKIIDATEQLILIAEVTEIVEDLFENGELKPEVDLEREREVRELVSKIKSQEARRELDILLVEVATALTKDDMEFAAAQREAAEIRRQEEERRQAQLDVQTQDESKSKEDEVEQPVETVDPKAEESEKGSGGSETDESETEESGTETEEPGEDELETDESVDPVEPDSEETESEELDEEKKNT